MAIIQQGNLTQCKRGKGAGLEMISNSSLLSLMALHAPLLAVGSNCPVALALLTPSV